MTEQKEYLTIEDKKYSVDKMPPVAAVLFPKLVAIQNKMSRLAEEHDLLNRAKLSVLQEIRPMLTDDMLEDRKESDSNESSD